MNKKRLRKLGLVTLLCIGGATVAVCGVSITSHSADHAQGEWTVEQVLPTPTPTGTDTPSFHSRYARQPCRETKPAPSSIAAESGLFLLSNPPPIGSVGEAPEVMDQLI